MLSTLSKAVMSGAGRISCVSFTGRSGVAQSVRLYAREAVRPTVRRRTLKETLTAPATETPFTIGRIGVAGAAGLGIGALCFYGLGLSNQVGTIDRAALWPDYVRKRVHETYQYFAGSLAVTAASTVMIARSHRLMALVSRTGWMALLATIGAMMGTGMICRSIPYDPSSVLGVKQLAWMLHCGVIGAVVAPLTLLGGPIMMRAALYTAGIVGGLSAVAACAPSDKFLNIGGPLAIGMGVVFVSSVGTWFLPASTALGAGLYSIAVYGGLVLFSGFLLYDTQRVIRGAEAYPSYATKPYDPVNACLGIYLDTINIFIRLAMILAGGGNRRK